MAKTVTIKREMNITGVDIKRGYILFDDNATWNIYQPTPASLRRLYRVVGQRTPERAGFSAEHLAVLYRL